MRCRFQNERLASLTIVKSAGPSDGTFVFTSTQLDIPPITTTGGTGQTTLSDLVPASYDVVEVVPEGWGLTAASCDDGSPITDIVLQPGGAVTCTFTNELAPEPPTPPVAPSGAGPELSESDVPGELPFTGYDAQRALTVALACLALGLLLRRGRARLSVGS